MEVYAGSNLSSIYDDLISDLSLYGKTVGPRGTQTVELHPVTIVTDFPMERIISVWGRSINLAFAMAEVIWILAGRKDVKMLEFYNSQIKQFSDDGKEFNAPYGYRMREAWGHDQFSDAVGALASDRDSRRAVISIWHPIRDANTDQSGMPRETKDRACNIIAHPMVRNKRLDWLQIVRSNDVILGVPYNMIQWTSVQEYMARQLQIEPGTFTYVADSLHAYLDTYYDFTQIKKDIAYFDIYSALNVKSTPMEFVQPRLLEDIESSIRSGRRYFRSIPLSHGLYWTDVFFLLLAHREFKFRHHKAMIECIKKTSSVFAAVQLKFYWGVRYHNHREGNRVRRYIEETFPEEVQEWITEVVRPPARSLGKLSS